MTEPRKQLEDVLLGFQTMTTWLKIVIDGRLPEDESFTNIAQTIADYMPWRLDQLTELDKEHADALTELAHRNIARVSRKAG
jgi:hypothetical protein